MKTEVYSLRISRAVRADLERVARRRKVKVSNVIHDAISEWLAKNGREIADDEEQKRLHANVERYIGAFASGDSTGSTRVREIVRQRLAKKYGRRSRN